MARRLNLNTYTLKVIRNRLQRIADARGSLTTEDLRTLFGQWLRRDTVVPALALAGRIHRLMEKGVWNDRDRAAFEHKYTPSFVAQVDKCLRKMEKSGSRRI